MLCRWISKSVPPLPFSLFAPSSLLLSSLPPDQLTNTPGGCEKRYEIENGTTGWEDAEKRVDRLLHLSGEKGKKKNVEAGGMTVSVRSGKKRKGGDGGGDEGVVEKIYNEEMGGGGVKKKVKKDRGKDKDKGKRL